MNESEQFELFKIKQKIITETRALHVDELVQEYKSKVMKAIRQNVVKYLDMVWDGKPVPKLITILIPNMMASTTYRKEPVRMKGLVVRVYFDTNRIRDDYTRAKGPGKGSLYASAAGDLNPGLDGKLDPTPMLLNLPVIYGIQHCKKVKGGYALPFEDMVDDFGSVYDTPEEIVDAIMEEYFTDYFQEALSHELTHFVQSNNQYVDGTENAKEYDPEEVFRTGQYFVDELEVEARLHQRMPAYVDSILRSRDITPIVKQIVYKMFANRFKEVPKDVKHKYFNMVLRLCQAIKTVPGITKYNYNTPKMRRALHDAL